MEKDLQEQDRKKHIENSEMIERKLYQEEIEKQ